MNSNDHYIAARIRRSGRADAALVAPIPTTTRAALRAIEARRVARIDPADLNDAALGRCADQWAGTERGGAALAEIARREDAEATEDDGQGWGRQALVEDDTPDTFNSLDYPAGYARCNCSECRSLAEREAEIRAARAADDTPTPNRFSVTEHIRHGDYRYDMTETATTLLGAVYAVLASSPYNNPTATLANRVAAGLFTTGHAEHGWSAFER